MKPGVLWKLCLLALFALLAGALIGSTRLHLGELGHGGADAHIFWNLRVPRALTAFLCGGMLSLCGLVFQTLFLNHLATPYTLGVSSASACGAAAVIVLAGASGAGASLSVTAGALLGAGVAMLLVWGFSRTRVGSERHVMLLAGVAVSFFFSSLLLFVQSISDFSQSFQIVRWLMGGLAVAGYHEVWLLTPTAVIGGTIVLLHRGRLNLLLLGDDLAHTRGLPVRRTKTLLFVTASVMAGVTVSVTGPIGFVGLVAPHICRLLWGGDHRTLAPAALLTGGSALVLCDLLARVAAAPTEIPVGVITSLLGAPFFFWLLLRQGDRV